MKEKAAGKILAVHKGAFGTVYKYQFRSKIYAIKQVNQVSHRSIAKRNTSWNMLPNRPTSPNFSTLIATL